jgi:hypothetical protein
VPALGLSQILAWASSYYLPAVIAKPVADSTGWPLAWVVGGLSLGLLVSGLIAPTVGRSIEARGGRPVLATSALMLSAGLLALALSWTLPAYFLAWVTIGAGMGAGLYDAAFATLGRIYGEGARRAITALTLFGGFASTVGWPLSAWLVAMLGWRGACGVYAAIQITLVLPAYLTVLPRERRDAIAPPQDPAHKPDAAVDPSGAHRAMLIALMAVAFTLGDVIWSVLSVHLIAILEARELALTAAVVLGMLVGPSQVAARAIEMLTGRLYHPIWTLTASSFLFAAGVALLWAGPPWLALGFMLYGAGGGMRSIARGTLPLALFGAPGYPGLIGRLAMPSLLAQSISPTIGAWLLERIGAAALLAVLTAIASVQLATVAVLWAATRRLRAKI